MLSFLYCLLGWSILTELTLVIAIASPQWMSCGEKPHAKSYGLWTAGNVTENPAVFFTMVGSRPVVVLWLLFASAAIVVYVIRLKFAGERSTWLRTDTRTLVLCQVVLGVAAVSSSLVGISSIECDWEWGSITAIAAVICNAFQFLTIMCEGVNLYDFRRRISVVSRRTESQILSESENQETEINGADETEPQVPQIL